MSHNDNRWQQEYERLQLVRTRTSSINDPHKVGTPIYWYGNRKIEQCNYLVNRGVHFQQEYLFDRILFSLPQCWDEDVQYIYRVHNLERALTLLTLLEKAEKNHQLWIELRTKSINKDCDVSRHMHAKLDLANRLKRMKF